MDFAKSDDLAALAAANPELPDEDREWLIERMRDCLAGRGGEVSASARVVALGEAYLALNDTGRERFLEFLARDFDVDGPVVNDTMAVTMCAAGYRERRAAERALRHVLEAPRVHLLSQLNILPEVVKFLVHIRDELRGLFGEANRISPASKTTCGACSPLGSTWIFSNFAVSLGRTRRQWCWKS